MLCKVLRDEVALLLAVEGHKNRAKEYEERHFRSKLLTSVSKPIEFISKATKEITTMETPWITRAKELVALYQALVDKTNNKSERLDLLLSVTITVSVRTQNWLARTGANSQRGTEVCRTLADITYRYGCCF